MSNKLPKKPIEILLVEDNPADILLTREALEEGKINNNLNVVTNGQMAIDFLKKNGDFKISPTPDIILLDLNLPKKDGREVLSEIKNDDDLKEIPVIILTTSKSDEDVLKTYRLHANCYINKPVDIEQFYRVIKSIEDFWFLIVKLPKGN